MTMTMVIPHKPVKLWYLSFVPQVAHIISSLKIGSHHKYTEQQ